MSPHSVMSNGRPFPPDELPVSITRFFFAPGEPFLYLHGYLLQSGPIQPFTAILPTTSAGIDALQTLDTTGMLTIPAPPGAPHPTLRLLQLAPYAADPRTLSLN